MLYKLYYNQYLQQILPILMILAPGKNKDLLATLVEFGYAEYGSALEMLAAAKSTESPKTKIGYINHALDEYRHAALIFKVLNIQINQLLLL